MWHGIKSTASRRSRLTPCFAAVLLACVISWASASVETGDTARTRVLTVSIESSPPDNGLPIASTGSQDQLGARFGQPVHNAGSVDASTLTNAVRGIQQALDALESDKPPQFPRTNSARDSLSNFTPNLLDGSDENIARVEMHALSGSDDGLAAFLVMAAHFPDYKERSQHVLFVNAARGSVLALTTLSERADTGYGFARADRETSLFFEYLAWATGLWNYDADAESFRPSIAHGWTETECRNASALANTIAAKSEPFNDRDLSEPPRCGADH